MYYLCKEVDNEALWEEPFIELEDMYGDLCQRFELQFNTEDVREVREVKEESK